eukprot:TRINITY_DN76594_c0_g1_i1.p1 TRINITY_DN76594_c0_g1~~TRINITY_DN76594_c0_g1_i1.p1  ORF type:complete len:148 (-),score=6.22 TRINITY_DN76594_c0_g1_i1:87-530(-)
MQAEATFVLELKACYAFATKMSIHCVMSDDLLQIECSDQSIKKHCSINHVSFVGALCGCFLFFLALLLRRVGKPGATDEEAEKHLAATGDRVPKVVRDRILFTSHNTVHPLTDTSSMRCVQLFGLRPGKTVDADLLYSTVLLQLTLC